MDVSETRHYRARANVAWIASDRLRQSHGARNMAAVRRFVLDLVRASETKGSVKTRRLVATWSPDALLHILDA